MFQTHLPTTVLGRTALVITFVALAVAEDPAKEAVEKPKSTNHNITLDDVREPDPRFVVGYHQAGAASAEGTGHFFTNFYIERRLWNPRWRMWGNVTIGSYPQQISSPVGEFITGLAEQYSKLPVNQVAQSAEFQAGLERLFKVWDVDKSEFTTNGHRIRTFGLIAGFGATSPLTPVDSRQVFAVPAATSGQYRDLVGKYPQLANAKYVGFTTPDRDRVFRQWGTGFRVSTYVNNDDSAHLSPPATYEVMVGQDEAITGGVMRGAVARFSCFYPLQIPGTNDTGDQFRFLYLFGTASLRAGRGYNHDPFILQPATDINGYDPGVVLITTRSNRDTYRVGIGVDFVNLFKSMAKSKN
jgi:hypothetical protein